MRKCCECGSTEFSAHQLCKMTVVVDESNTYIPLTNLDCYIQTPSGPYSCMECGKEYNDLSELSYELSDKLFISVRSSDVVKINAILKLTDEEFAKEVEKGAIKKEALLFHNSVCNDNYIFEYAIFTGDSNVYLEMALFDKGGGEIDSMGFEEIPKSVSFIDENKVIKVVLIKID